jgi:hypothetical protein
VDFLNDPEASYRRGYVHGAWDVIEAVRGLLPPKEQSRLEDCFNGPAQEWRDLNLSGKSKRAENGDFSAAMCPPRRALRLGKNLPPCT